MPPKSAKKPDTVKPNKASQINTPTKIKKPSSESTVSPAKEAEEKKTPKRAKLDVEHHDLPNTGVAPIQVTVSYDTSPDAKSSKNGYVHKLCLTGMDSFRLVGTSMITEGPLQGRQVIIVQPPRAFELMKLTPEIRKHIYTYYFAHKGVLDDPIPLESKRKTTGDLWAKAYSEGSKNRVALLATCKVINNEASPVLYSKSLRVGDPTSMLQFLSDLPSALVERLQCIHLVSYKSALSKVAMNSLAQAKHLRRIHIENGVATSSEPAKSADSFYGDIRVFLDAITSALKEGQATSNKTDALKVIELGDDALTFKEKAYTEGERKQFFKALEAKAK